MDKIQKKQRRCKFCLLGFLPCYHTPKNKTPRGPDAQSWSCNAIPNFNTPAFCSHRPQLGWAGNTRIAPGLSHSQSCPQHPLNSSPCSQKQLCSAMQDQALREHQHSKGDRGRRKVGSRFSGTWRQLSTPAQVLLELGSQWCPIQHKEKPILTKTFILFHTSVMPFLNYLETFPHSHHSP